ncbi:hypothetical protein [Vibrio rarus]|uniref:hypothetical protein n=1 Tax=Vibrio rarus TaxID=413403 RepID=UPI0021C465C1|nr:hypothetical protein [Vibrio rarus]
MKRILLLIMYSFALMLFAFSSVSAQDFLCSATQKSYDTPALLGTECPIGVSLLGKTEPTYQHSTFWIQCGIYLEEFTLQQVKLIYPNVSQSIWNKAESIGRRCLIGPYHDFAQVNLELSQLRTISGFETSFIREVSNTYRTK